VKIKCIILSLIACLLSGKTAILYAGVTMAGDYQVVDVLELSTPAERTAADELRLYLHRIFGKLKVGGYRIHVGHTEENKRFFGEELLNSLQPEEFVIKSSTRGDIHLAGGRPRGTLYAAYWLLDRLLGVRWYTPDFEYVPTYETFDLGDIDIRQKPVFLYRPRPGTTSPMQSQWDAATRNGVRAICSMTAAPIRVAITFPSNSAANSPGVHPFVATPRIC